MKIKCGLVLIIGLIFLVSCSQPNSIDQNIQSTQTAATGVLPTLEDENGCPSKYDGNWKGIFTYEYKVPIKNSQGFNTGEYKTITKGINVVLTLKCNSVSDENVFLDITHAIVSHPAFGCQVGGCVPLTENNGASLPTEDTVVGKESTEIHMITATFPNGRSFFIGAMPDLIRVGVNGMVISNTLNPAYECNTWVAGATTVENSIFPPEDEAPEFVLPTCFKSWSLNKVS